MFTDYKRLEKIHGVDGAFEILNEIQDYATKLLRFYNNLRPYKVNGGKSPLMAA